MSKSTKSTKGRLKSSVKRKPIFFGRVKEKGNIFCDSFTSKSNGYAQRHRHTLFGDAVEMRKGKKRPKAHNPLDTAHLITTKSKQIFALLKKDLNFPTMMVIFQDSGCVQVAVRTQKGPQSFFDSKCTFWIRNQDNCMLNAIQRALMPVYAVSFLADCDKVSIGLPDLFGGKFIDRKANPLGIDNSVGLKRCYCVEAFRRKRINYLGTGIPAIHQSAAGLLRSGE